MSPILRAAAALLALGAVLTGCASRQTAAGNAASAQDALFGDYMQQHGLTKYGDPPTLRRLAHQVCDAEASGSSAQQAVGTVTAAGFPSADADQFAASAATVYCPQYTGGFNLLDPLDSTP